MRLFPGRIMLAFALGVLVEPVNAALSVDLEARSDTAFTRAEVEALDEGKSHTAIARAIFGLQQGVEDRDRPPGLLVLSAGAWRAKATIYYPTSNSTRFRSIEYRGRLIDGTRLIRDLAKAAWNATVHGEKVVAQHLGSTRRISHATLEAGDDGTELPAEILVVRIPLTGRATVNTVEAFREIEESKNTTDAAAVGKGFRDTVLRDLERLVEAALGPQQLSAAARDAQTALDWLYQIALDLHPTLASGGEHGQNAACANPETRRFTSTHAREEKTKELIAQLLDANIPGDEIRSLHSAFDADTLELILTGAFDPVILNVLECQVRRDLFVPNESHELANIVLRSQYHRIAYDALRKAKGTAPEFFSAVHRVTSSMGVGYVDLPAWVQSIDPTDDDIVKAAVRTALNLASRALFENLPQMTFGQCPGAQSAKRCAVCDAARDINRVLFDHNRTVMRRLARGDVGSWFDPLGLGKAIRDRFAFDVRMVLMEQAIVEHVLRKRSKTFAPEAVACVDRQLTALAKSVHQVKPKPGVRHHQWSGYVAGQLVKSLESRDSRSAFSRFSKSGAYIFAPRFGNHWWRVAIGVAYVLVLHETRRQGADTASPSLLIETANGADRVPDDLMMRYRKLLLQILEEAPKAGVEKQAQRLLDTLAATRGLGKAERARQTSRLTRALTTLDKPDDSPRLWQGCDATTLNVTATPTPRRAKWSRILNALTHETHAATLADAFESAGVQGETKLTDGFPGDDAANRRACRVLETRMRRTFCLLAGQTQCDAVAKSFQASPDHEHTVLLSFDSEDATAFRSELPSVWPFLVESIERTRGRRRRDAATPESLAKTTILRRARWERGVAKAQILARSPEATLRALGLDSPEAYRTLVVEARGVPTDEKSGTDAWIKKADLALAPGASLERVRKSRTKLERMRARIARVHASMRPQPYPPPRLHAGREARSAVSASGVGDHLPGVVFNLVRGSGEASDGRPKHRAIGVFEGSADGDGQGDRAALPIGLEVEDVVVESDGSLRVLDDGRQNISVRESAARALLSSFGVPELFSDATVSYDLPSKDLRSLEMTVTPSIRGYALEEFKLVLLEGGAKRQDIAKQLIDGLKRSVQGTAGLTLRKLLAPLEFETRIGNVGVALTLCKDEDPEVRLEGDSLPESGAPPPLRVRVSPKICLTLRHADKHDDDALLASAKASPEILLDANGLHVVTMGIDDETLNGVEDALERALDLENNVCRNLSKPCPVEAVNIELTTGTETVGRRAGSSSHGISIGVHATVRLPLGKDGEHCIVPLRVAFALADADGVLEDLSTAATKALAGAADGVKKCAGAFAAARGAKTASDWFASKDHELNIIGMKWRLDCEKGAESTCIRAEGLSEAVFDIVATVEKTGKTYRVRGISIKIEDGSVHIGLRRLRQEDRKVLAQALVSQVQVLAESTFGEGFIGERLKIEDETIGEFDNGNLYFFADITVLGVPYLGDVALGRMNLANAGDPEALKEAVGHWAANEVAARLSEEIQGDVQIPHVGTLKLASDAIKIAPKSDSAGAELALTGTLVIWEDIETKMTIKAPLPDFAPLQFEADPDGTETALKFVTETLVELVPFAGDRIKVENPRFAEADPGTGRYGLLMGAKVSFDPFKLTVKAEKIVVSIDGVRLAGALKGRFPGSLEFGSVALSRIGGTYYPGHDGTRRGLIVEADIAPGTSALAKIAKMDTSLDLRELGSLRFVLNGDVIVLDSVPILAVKGLVDLDGGAVRVDATTPEMLAELLSAQMSAWLGRVNPDGREGEHAEPSVGAKTRLSVFGAEILETIVRADLAGKGRIKARAAFAIPLGSGHVDYESALDFGGATLDAGVSVTLLKWEALGARVTASPDWASASIKVLFFELGLGAPSVDRLDSWTAVQALRGLLAMSLEDIAKLQPGSPGGSITKVSIGRDGKARAENVSSHQDSAAKDPSSPSETRAEGEPESSKASKERQDEQMPEKSKEDKEENKEIMDEEREAPPPEKENEPKETPPLSKEQFPRVYMMDMGFGDAPATLIYCHRVAEDRYIRVADRRSPPDARTFESGIDPESMGFIHTFRWTPGGEAPMPCVESREEDWEGSNWLWQREWVPIGTRDGQWSLEGCDTRPARPWLDVRSEEGTAPGPREALPVEAALACWDDDVSAVVGLFWHRYKKDLAALIQCPQAEVIPEEIKKGKAFQKICGDNASSFLLLDVGDPRWERTGRLGNLVAPEIAYRLFEIARSTVLGQERVTDEPTAVEFADRLKATLYPEEEPAQGLTMLVSDASTGRILGTGHLEDETVRTLVLQETARGATGEAAWTRALLGSWWQQVVASGGRRHPNFVRPRTVRSYEHPENASVNVLAWTLTRGTGFPPIESVFWSWPTLYNGQRIETRQVEVDTTPPRLRYSEVLVDVLARRLPQLDHKGKTHIVVTRDEERYGIEFFAYLPPDGKDGDVRIVIAPADAGVGAKAARDWTEDAFESRERHARCGTLTEIEDTLENANVDSGGGTVEIDLRKWTRDPGGTLLRLALAHDPVDALRRADLACR